MHRALTASLTLLFAMLIPANAPSAVAATPSAPTSVLLISEQDGPPGQPLVVGGRLLDDHRNPVQGRTVTLVSSPPDSNQDTTIGSATTDAQGGVSFHDRPSGHVEYQLIAPASGSDPELASDVAEVWPPTTGGAQAPWSPNPVAAEGGPDDLRVSWAPPRYAGTAPITSYDVTVYTQPGGQRVATETLNDPSARSDVIHGLQPGNYAAWVRAINTVGDSNFGFSQTVTVGSGQHLAADAPNTNVLCGWLPYGGTTVDAGSGTVRICRAGVVVPLGSSLTFSGNAGPLTVDGTGGGSITATGGTIRTAGTSQGSAVTFDSSDPQFHWGGITIDPLQEHAGGIGYNNYPVAISSGFISLGWATIRHSSNGVTVPGGAARVSLDHVTVDSSNQTGIKILDTSGALSNVTVSNAGSGVLDNCQFSFTYRCVISVTDSSVTGVPAPGFELDYADQLVAHGDTVTGTTTPSGHQTSPAVVLTGDAFETSGEDRVDDFVGSNNALGVTYFATDIIDGDLTWRPVPTDEPATPTPLAYVNGDITMEPGSTLTVPAGATVASTAGAFTLDSATLTALGPTRFTNTADPSLPNRLCNSSIGDQCGSADPFGWGGILVEDDAHLDVENSTLTKARDAVIVHTADSSKSPTVRLINDDVSNNTGGVLTESYEFHGSAAGSLTIQGSTFHDIGPDPALMTNGLNTTDVSNSSFTNVPAMAVSGTTVQYGDNFVSIASDNTVSLTNLTLHNTGGLTVSYANHPTVHNVEIDGTAQDPYVIPSIATRPLTLFDDNMSIGPGDDVDAITGANNTVDVTAISGSVTGDLTWVTPTNSTTVRPFGYAVAAGGIASGITMTPGTTLTIPANAVVKTDAAARIYLEGATLNAAAGGIVFTGTGDNTVGQDECVANSCDPNWFGIFGEGQTAPQGDWGATRVYGPGQVVLDNDTVRHAGISLDSRRQTPYTVIAPDGTIDLNNDTVDGFVRGIGLSDLTVTNSTVGDDILSQGTATASITHDTAGNIHIAGVADPYNFDDPSQQSALTLQDVTATQTSTAAYWLQGIRTTVGPGEDVDNLRASGAGAVLFLDDVHLGNDLTWVTPYEAAIQHAPGYVTSGLTLEGSHSLTVPAGSVIKADGIVLDGGDLDATDGLGSTFAELDDARYGVPTCQAPYEPNTACRNFPNGPEYNKARFSLVADAATGHTGTATFNGVTVLGDVTAAAGANDTNHPDAVDATASDIGDISLTSTAATVSASTIGGVSGNDPAITLSNTRISRHDTGHNFGITMTGGSLTADHVEVTGIDNTSLYPPPNAAVIQALQGASATVACADIHDNTGGLAAVSSGTVTLSQSNLTGNVATQDGRPSYDLEDHSPATTDQVWWGQPGGPTAGQVSQPANDTDTNDAATPNPCATARTIIPPAPVTGLQALPTDHGVTVNWTSPTSGDPTWYVVTGQPGGLQTTVGEDKTSATFTGLDPGTAYTFTVTAHTSQGDVPSTPSESVNPLAAPPVPPHISAFDAPLFTGASTANKTTVDVDTNPSAAVSVTATQGTSTTTTTTTADNAGHSAIQLDLSQFADGTINLAAVATTAQGASDPADATIVKDTTAPTVTNLAAPSSISASTANAVAVTGHTEPSAAVALDASAGCGCASAQKTVNADSHGNFSGSLNLAAFPDGAFTISATPTDRAGNTGNNATQSVTKSSPSATTLSVSTTPGGTTAGSALTYFSQVASSATHKPTGYIDYLIGSSLQCRATVFSGEAACKSTRAPVGTDRVTARYSGDPQFLGSTASTTLSVAKATPMIRVTTKPRHRVRVGGYYTISAEVVGAPTRPTGDIRVSRGHKRLCVLKSAGAKLRSCRIAASKLGHRGNHRVTLVYRGDATHESTVRSLSVRVLPPRRHRR